MALFKDTKDFTITLNENDTDWYTLLQFCVCKVNPKYFKNIRISKYYERWELQWESLNNSHLWTYPFPQKVTKETIKKLEKQLPQYIKVKWR